MKNKKRWITKLLPVATLIMTFLLSFGFAEASHLGVDADGCEIGHLCNPLTVSSFSDFVEAILDAVVQIGIPIAALAIIYSGFLFVIAQGNDEKLKTAKVALLWSLIGTGILLGAWAISAAVGTTITAIIPE